MCVCVLTRWHRSPPLHVETCNPAWRSGHSREFLAHDPSEIFRTNPPASGNFFPNKTSGGASAVMEPGHLEVRKSSSQVTRSQRRSQVFLWGALFLQKSWRLFVVVPSKHRPPTANAADCFTVKIKQIKRSKVIWRTPFWIIFTLSFTVCSADAIPALLCRTSITCNVLLTLDMGPNLKQCCVFLLLM